MGPPPFQNLSHWMLLLNRTSRLRVFRKQLSFLFFSQQSLLDHTENPRPDLMWKRTRPSLKQVPRALARLLQWPESSFVSFLRRFWRPSVSTNVPSQRRLLAVQSLLITLKVSPKQLWQEVATAVEFSQTTKVQSIRKFLPEPLPTLLLQWHRAYHQNFIFSSHGVCPNRTRHHESHLSRTDFTR